MLEFTPKQFNIPADFLSQVEKHGMAKLLGENGHSFYIYPENKQSTPDDEIAMRFDSVDEFKEWFMKETNQTWAEIEKSANEVED